MYEDDFDKHNWKTVQVLIENAFIKSRDYNLYQNVEIADHIEYLESIIYKSLEDKPDTLVNKSKSSDTHDRASMNIHFTNKTKEEIDVNNTDKSTNKDKLADYFKALNNLNS